MDLMCLEARKTQALELWKRHSGSCDLSSVRFGLGFTKDVEP